LVVTNIRPGTDLTKIPITRPSLISTIIQTNRRKFSSLQKTNHSVFFHSNHHQNQSHLIPISYFLKPLIFLSSTQQLLPLIHPSTCGNNQVFTPMSITTTAVLTTGSTAPGTSTRCRSVINKSSRSVPLTPTTSIPVIKGVNAVRNDQILPEGHGTQITFQSLRDIVLQRNPYRRPFCPQIQLQSHRGG
jgi:hypothetical protein